MLDASVLVALALHTAMHTAITTRRSPLAARRPPLPVPDLSPPPHRRPHPHADAHVLLPLHASQPARCWHPATPLLLLLPLPQRPNALACPHCCSSASMG